MNQNETNHPIFHDTNQAQSGEKVKFLYAPQGHNLIRLTGLYGLISFVFAFIGYLFFTTQSLWSLVFLPLILVISYSTFFNLTLTVLYPKFDVKDHKNFINSYWDYTSEPSVDVLLPVCGENIDILRNTWEGVSKLDYKNYKVYVCDDKGDQEVKKLALSFNFNYLSRPNKGQWKKAGNIQYAQDNSTGKYMLILDADFKPYPWAITECIPYLEADLKISIVQTPQYFNNSKEKYQGSPIEFGAGYVVEDFYRILLPARNLFKIPICVGTSAFYRRSAIVNSGGTPKLAGSEDVAQGLATMKHGYYVKYLPIVCTIGDNPENMDQHFRQHQRWSKGSIAMPFTKFFAQAKMSLLARLYFITSAMYYLGEILKPVFGLHLLILILAAPTAINLQNSAWFVPFTIYLMFIQPVGRISRPHKAGMLITGLNQIFTYTVSVYQTIFKIKTSWVSTGLKTKSVDRGLVTCIWLGFINFLLVLLGLFIKGVIDPKFLINSNFAIINWTLLQSLINYFIYSLYGYIFIQKINGKIKESSVLHTNYIYYFLLEFFSFCNIALLIFNVLQIF